MWHASVCKRGKDGRSTPSSGVSPKDTRSAVALGMYLLDGVGTGATLRHTKHIAFHTRRRLSDQELAGLDPAWLAIPAVDMG